MVRPWLKGILVFILLSTMVFGGTLPAAASTSPGLSSSLGSYSSVSISLDETADGTTIEVFAGDVIVISLESNHSTGFGWHLSDISDDAVLQHTGYEWVPATGGVPGVPGTEIWTFRAIKSGTSTLLLEYYQPWQPENVAQTFTLTAGVSPVGVPASSDTGPWLMAAALAGLMCILMYRRTQNKPRNLR